MISDLVRETLVRAYLEGVKQAFGTLHRYESNEHCAIGALHYYAHDKSGDETKACFYSTSSLGHIHDRPCMRKYALSCSDTNDLITANDSSKMDFLSIARKVGIE